MMVDLAFSPCPNDTYIFHALLHECVATAPFRFTARIADVEELNAKAAAGAYGVTKLSFAAYLGLKERYTLLEAGAALGFGCGPMLVAGRVPVNLEKARIAVPGRHTTAYLLLRLWNNKLRHIEFVRFDEILPGIAAGRFDAGLIIHEGRFVYPDYGCTQLVDLGAWWETQTGLPIPLGCIAIREDLIEHKAAVEDLIRDSLHYARQHPDVGRAFIKSQAQELDDAVIDRHIALYVNDFSLALGDQGRRAIAVLEERARCQEIL